MKIKYNNVKPYDIVLDKEYKNINFDKLNLYIDTLDDYMFLSCSCGCLHDDIKEVTNEFNKIID